MGLRAVSELPDHNACDHSHPRVPRPDREFVAVGGPSTHGSMLRLQRLAGNRAVAAMRVPVQRCGPIPCDCGPEERAEAEKAAVQRDCDPATATCVPVDGADAETSHVDTELIAKLAEIDARGTGTAPAGNQPAVPPGARPLAATLRPDGRYAFAATTGFVSGTGYSVPAGVLADEALAAESTATAEGMVAAQGLRTAGTVVAEGSTIARSLIAVGEGILAVEAGGAGEVEAATGPPGWVVGAIVVVAAGAAIGVGYLLLRDPQRASSQPQASTQPQAAPQAQTRNPNQTCEDSVLDALQAQKDKICKAIPGSSCSPSKVSPKRLAKMPCSQIRLRIEAIRACIAIRERIQNECFGGVPDQAHRDAINELQNGVNHCLALEAINCASGHPMAGL